jgi:hypothetical protein
MTQRLVLSGLPVALSRVLVVGESPCRSLGDSTSATYLVWEQVRAALSAAQLTASMRGIASTKLMYERLRDPVTDSVREQEISIRATSMTEPWQSMTADSLRKVGYVVTERDGWMIYHAPDIDVLLSDLFLEDHCFRLAPSSDPERIGIAFEPIQARRRTPEIRGTLWVDRRSSELRRMEFRYANIARERAQYAGGTSEFVRMANGAWVISQWEIRMPLLERRRTGPRLGRHGPPTLQIHTAGVKINGGQLLSVRQGDDTLWSRPPMVLAGSVSDSASQPVAAARISLSGTSHAAVSDAAGRFTIADVITGAYTVEVRTPSLDSIGVVHESRLGFTDAAAAFPIVVPSARQIAATLCSNSPAMRAPGATRGVIAGRVSGSGAPSSVRNTQVVAEWAEGPAGADSSADDATRRQRIETRSDARGMFRLCGVPIGVDLILRAAGDGGSSAPARTIILAGQSYTYVSLMLDSAASYGADPAGAALEESARNAMVDREGEALVRRPSEGPNQGLFSTNTEPLKEWARIRVSPFPSRISVLRDVRGLPPLIVD